MGIDIAKLDWARIARMAETMTAPEIARKIGFPGSSDNLRRAASRRGIETQRRCLALDWQAAFRVAAEGGTTADARQACGWRGTKRGFYSACRRLNLRFKGGASDDVRAKISESAKRNRAERTQAKLAPKTLDRPPHNQEPDRGAKPMYADRTRDAVAGMRRRGATDSAIIQTLKLTPAQASEYGLKTVSARDPFNMDPRRRR